MSSAVQCYSKYTIFLYSLSDQYTFYSSFSKSGKGTCNNSYQNQFFLYGGKTGGTQIRIALELAISSFYTFAFQHPQEYLQDSIYRKIIKSIGVCNWYSRIEQYQHLCKDPSYLFLIGDLGEGDYLNKIQSNPESCRNLFCCAHMTPHLEFVTAIESVTSNRFDISAFYRDPIVR